MKKNNNNCKIKKLQTELKGKALKDLAIKNSAFIECTEQCLYIECQIFLFKCLHKTYKNVFKIIKKDKV